MDPDSLNRFRTITWLGSVSQKPDAPVIDFYDANTLADPAAASRVLSSDVPLSVAPIDLSYRAVLDDSHLAAIRAGETPQARFAWQILPFYCDFHQPLLGRWTACMHDPIAGAIAIDPDLAEVDLGVVVQAYLRDSRDDLAAVIAVSALRERPLMVRLVKGAYWDTETIQARAAGWPGQTRP